MKVSIESSGVSRRGAAVIASKAKRPRLGVSNCGLVWVASLSLAMTIEARSVPPIYMLLALPSLLRGLVGVLHGGGRAELDVVELAVDLLDLADIDGLHDVAGLGVDRNRSPRAGPARPFHRRDQGVAVGR